MKRPGKWYSTRQFKIWITNMYNIYYWKWTDYKRLFIFW